MSATSPFHFQANKGDLSCFVTGATGFVGNRLVEELLTLNFRVNILIRKTLNLTHQNLTVFQGDLNDKEMIRRAMKNCDYVFHLAAYASIWSRDKLLPYRSNVEGTRNVLESALENKVKKVVFTSTAGTFPSSQDENEVVAESYPRPEEYFTVYEQTKYEAENLCLEYFQKGLKTVIVNPTRIYGPGVLNKSNSVTILIKRYLSGKLQFIPGNGKLKANYVFIEDVVRGHISALESGAPGEKYILGGANLSYAEFFDLLSDITGMSRILIHVPFFLLFALAQTELVLARLFSKEPLITPSWLKRFQQHRLVSSDKAVSTLDYKVTPMKEGIQKTLSWIKSNPHE